MGKSTIRRIDLASGKVDAIVQSQVGVEIEDGTCGPDGKIYFAHYIEGQDDGKLVRYDPDGSNPVEMNDGGRFPEGPSFDENGNLYFNTRRHFRNRQAPTGYQDTTGVWKIPGADPNATAIQVVSPDVGEQWGEGADFTQAQDLIWAVDSTIALSRGPSYGSSVVIKSFGGPPVVGVTVDNWGDLYAMLHFDGVSSSTTSYQVWWLDRFGSSSLLVSGQGSGSFLETDADNNLYMAAGDGVWMRPAGAASNSSAALQRVATIPTAETPVGLAYCPPEPALADLEVAAATSPDPAIVERAPLPPSGSPGTIPFGTSFTLTATVANMGSGPARGAVLFVAGVVDPWPPGCRVAPNWPGIGLGQEVVAFVAECSLGDLDPGASTTLTFEGVGCRRKVMDRLFLGFRAMTVSSTLERSYANNRADPSLRCERQAEFSVTQIRSPRMVALGSPLTYTIEVTNGGPSVVHKALLRIGLDPKLSALSYPSSCKLISPSVAIECELGFFFANESKVITISGVPCARPETQQATEVFPTAIETNYLDDSVITRTKVLAGVPCGPSGGASP